MSKHTLTTEANLTGVVAPSLHYIADTLRKLKSDYYRALTTILFLTMTAIIFSLSFAGNAKAGSLHALVNGRAIHLDSAPNGATLHEKNWGGGLHYDFDSWHENWIPFANASGFIDSNSNPSYYAGGGFMRRFKVSEELDNLHFDVGLVAFLMIRKGFNNSQPFPGILPVISVGTEHVSVNVTYIPKVDPKMVALFFFQLKVKLIEF